MSSHFRSRLLVLAVFYKGPWEYVWPACYALCGDRHPDAIRGWRKLALRLGNWAEERDRGWRWKYAVKQRKPHKRWSR